MEGETVLNCNRSAFEFVTGSGTRTAFSVPGSRVARTSGTCIRRAGLRHEPPQSCPVQTISNPLFKTSRENCASRYDFDPIDLTAICENYFPRCNYSPKQQIEEYQDNIPTTSWGTKITDHYKFAARKMLNLPGDRTFMGAILPPKVAHINGLISLTFKDEMKLVAFVGGATSVVFDFFIKLLGKQNLYGETLDLLPIVGENNPDVLARTLMLNCLSKSYAHLWHDIWSEKFCSLSWSTTNERLLPISFADTKSEWNLKNVLRTDFERRQAQVELDVLVAMLMGLSLKNLLAMYRIYFPVLKQNEEDTWYDANGRIIFTTNTILTNVGFDRKYFENPNAVTPIKRGDDPWDGIMKHAPAGYVFARTITDDTMPGGPVQRTIEYVAPFDRCDREQDYETVWKFFEEKYGKETEK